MAQEDDESQKPKSDSNSKDRHSSGKKIVSASIVVATILGGLAAGISIWQFGVQTTSSSSHSPSPSPTSSEFSPMLAEQHLVSQLIPGYEYDRLQQIIGSYPDEKIPLPSGNTVYQFNRTWEYLDLLVNNGRVLSVGVAAKTRDFRPTLYDDGTPLTVNGPPIERQVEYFRILGINGECATSGIDFFYAGFSIGTPLHDVSAILGWDGVSISTGVPMSVCSAMITGLGSKAAACRFDFENYVLSLGFSNCLNSLGLLQGIGKLSPSVVVVGAPGQPVIPDMMYLAYIPL